MIAGIPELPALDREATAIVAISNDSFGNYGPDDYRTAAGRVCYAGDGWVAVADLSMFTDCTREGWEPSPNDSTMLTQAWARTDEARASIGIEVCRVLIGVGVAYTGDLGGDNIQHGLHTLVSGGPVNYWSGYEKPARAVDALAWGSWFSGPFDVHAIASTAGTIEARAGATWTHGGWAVGGNIEARTGRWPTDVIREAMAEERGAWVDVAYHGDRWFVGLQASHRGRVWWTAGARF